MRKPGSKERIRQFLLAHIGEVVTSAQIRDAIGMHVTEWARRLRELREDEKWPIVTHNDRADLKPGQYILTEKPPEKDGINFTRAISAKLRAQVLDRNGFPAKCAASAPAKLIPIRDEKSGCISVISKTETLAVLRSYPIFEHSARPVTRAQRTSRPKSQLGFG